MIFSKIDIFNPLVTNGLSNPYHLDESTFVLRDIRSNFTFLFHFSMKFLQANRIAPDGTPHFTASHLGLFSMPMSHKKGARFIWVMSFVILQTKEICQKSKFTVTILCFAEAIMKILFLLFFFNL